MITFSVRVPASFTHFAAIYTPRKHRNPGRFPSPSEVVEKYGLMLPRDAKGLEGCRVSSRGGVNASSNKPPIIMPGNGTDDDFNAWHALCGRAARWRIPLDVLLIGRPLVAACQRWTPEPPQWVDYDGLDAVFVNAIGIGGDLSQSNALDARIAEIKESLK